MQFLVEDDEVEEVVNDVMQDTLGDGIAMLTRIVPIGSDFAYPCYWPQWERKG